LAYKNAYTAYNETKIKTANQGQLIIMLYDGALKRLDEAIKYMKEAKASKNPALIERYGNACVKAQAIISELSASLDFEQGSEIARSLFSLYNWFSHELLDANIHADSERVQNVRDMLAGLRVTWLSVIEKHPVAAAAPEPKDTGSAVNISLAG
jgi:flagellar protein FliS